MLLVDHTFVFHSQFIVTAVVWLVFQLVFVILNAHQLLVKLVVLHVGALLERLAAIVDHDDFLRRIDHTHVVNRPVRVNDVCFDILVFLRIKPFLLKVEIAPAIDEN